MTKTRKIDVYQEVTNQIVSSLEAAQELGKWIMPWNSQTEMPRNGSSQRPYNGINVLLLWARSVSQGYGSHEWFTYKQAQKEGGHVRRGEKGTRIVFWNFIKVKDKNSEDEDAKKTIPMCRFYTVFNRDQIEGLPAPEKKEPGPEHTDNRNTALEDLISETGALIRHGSGRAAYNPLRDIVIMPAYEDFKSADAYYSTILHELGHWTGHESRLDRNLNEGRFGDEAYAMEELVAELTSAFLCAEYGISNDLQHTEYIGGWLKVLKGDKYAIFSAARMAQEASKFLKGEGEEEAPKKEERATA